MGNKLAVLREFLLSVWELNILLSGNCSRLVVMETKWAMHDRLFYQHKMWLRQHFFYNKNGTREHAQTVQLGQPSFQRKCWDFFFVALEHSLSWLLCLANAIQPHATQYLCSITSGKAFDSKLVLVFKSLSYFWGPTSGVFLWRWYTFDYCCYYFSYNSVMLENCAKGSSGGPLELCWFVMMMLPYNCANPIPGCSLLCFFYYFLSRLIKRCISWLYPASGNCLPPLHISCHDCTYGQVKCLCHIQLNYSYCCDVLHLFKIKTVATLRKILCFDWLNVMIVSTHYFSSRYITVPLEYCNFDFVVVPMSGLVPLFLLTFIFNPQPYCYFFIYQQLRQSTNLPTTFNSDV